MQPTLQQIFDELMTHATFEHIDYTINGKKQRLMDTDLHVKTKTIRTMFKKYGVDVHSDVKKIETHECEACGESNPITRDTKGQIVPEECAFCKYNM